MANEQWVASLVPLMSSMRLEAVGYYRSKLFSVQDELSPFVSAASPLFSLLDRFAIATMLPAIERVILNVEHELRAYYSRLKSQPHSDLQNAMAYYLICVTIDEVLARAYLRLYGKVSTFKAFTPALYTDVTPGEQFFIITDYLKANPSEQLPLLELAYYCLMAGFEGDKQGRPDGRQLLEAEIDRLFHLIEQHRQVVKFALFESSKSTFVPALPYKQLGVMAGCLLVLLCVFFDFSQMLLEHQAKKIRFSPTFITTLDE